MKVPAVILAAGASRRLGQPKQLVRFHGEPLIHRIARIALEVCEPVLVVLGAEEAQIRGALEDLAVICLRNPHWQEGQASSLRVGLAAVPSRARAALFLACDQPAVDRALLEKLLAAHGANPLRRIACAYGGTRGVPALLPRSDFSALYSLHGESGAKALLQASEVLEVAFPGGEKDLDTPEDLRRLEIG